MIDFFNLIFDNQLENWFYVIAICYMLGKVALHIWDKWLMHKKGKDNKK